MPNKVLFGPEKIADYSTLGVVKTHGMGIYANAAGELSVACASSSVIKTGTNQYNPIVPYNQHEAIFYGLTKAAGVDLANETVTVGTYPASSKTAINSMIGSIQAPSSASAGDFLCYNGTAWVATTLSTWQGGSY